MIDQLGQMKIILNCENNKLCPICKAILKCIIEAMEKGAKVSHNRMTEEKAIEILKNRKDYYNMNHSGYDAVIKWLEGRVKRRKKK